VQLLTEHLEGDPYPPVVFDIPIFVADDPPLGREFLPMESYGLFIQADENVYRLLRCRDLFGGQPNGEGIMTSPDPGFVSLLHVHGKSTPNNAFGEYVSHRLKALARFPPYKHINDSLFHLLFILSCMR
jgi:hypothetical protein